MILPVPGAGPGDAVAWVRTHLGHLTAEGPDGVAEGAVRGGQQAADAALAALDLRGYAATRNEVWPEHRRGASRMSPYVRHGLIDLPTLWAAAADAPARDRDKYRDELLWQEYARHRYARLSGPASWPIPTAVEPDPWDRRMACLDLAVGELERDGWLVNQTRMWLASHWTVRHGADWRAGEDRFFRHLLDGSRAANRLGWEWTVGAATARPYGFSRWQVTKRAPGLCDGCPLRWDCPIEHWPDDRPVAAARAAGEEAAAGEVAVRRDPDPEATGGPRRPVVDGDPQAVWLTFESLGDGDPALAAHPDLPAVVVLDEPLLGRLRLSGKRLVFVAQTLADVATRRDLRIHLGDPVQELAGTRLAATFAPVPGWRRRAASLQVVAVHPWVWLHRPHGGSVASFSAWRRGVPHRP